MSKATQPDLGYFFHPKVHPHAPGHPRLDIMLRAMPSGQHFDPEEARFTVASGQAEIDRLTVSHPWRWPTTEYRVCAGRVVLQDRHDKEVLAFTFGGDLRIEAAPDCVTCSLTSPAPIIELIAEAPLHCLLADEAEALLARRRAAWAHDPKTFERRLATADPFILYAACLTALDRHFDHSPLEGRDELIYRFVQFLHAAMGVLRESDTWPEPPPCIEDVL